MNNPKSVFVAIAGRPNAGKSTLLNTLTNSDIYAQDQLFATLDPTTRQLDLPNKQQAILTDTVGFIQRLPHQLVAAFQSTLEEVVQSDVLLHVIDVSHELFIRFWMSWVPRIRQLSRFITKLISCRRIPVWQSV